MIFCKNNLKKTAKIFGGMKKSVYLCTRFSKGTPQEPLGRGARAIFERDFHTDEVVRERPPRCQRRPGVG